MIGICSLAKVLNSYEDTVIRRRASLKLLMTSVVSDSFKMLHTLPETITSPTFVFPICMIVFLGSICTAVLAMLATMFSSELS